ncbi:MAG: ATPase [Prolixibacteraceae bacterium]|jgi:N-acetylglucosamine kinase-like BadF-type ATPase|nr:ATPase [Prolixibacteraceae bacterium]
MILIADSGSSKTDWLLINENQLTGTIETPGINPYFQKQDEILQKLSPFFREETKKSVRNVYFYGAGCIKNESDRIVIHALKNIFPLAEIAVEDDMLGAARALLGRKEGIACILGTGSNSCKYDGTKITEKVPSLGFILGDEGSGAYLGKTFLNNYFKREVPQDLYPLIENELKLEMPTVLAAVYRGEYPSRYLAGFSKFILKNIGHPYFKNLIQHGLEAFIEKNVERYEGFLHLPVNFAGSIAFHYRKNLEEVAREKHIRIGKILHKPIDGLMQYHVIK